MSGQSVQSWTVEPIPDSEDVGVFIGDIEAAGGLRASTVLRIVWTSSSLAGRGLCALRFRLAQRFVDVTLMTGVRDLSCKHVQEYFPKECTDKMQRVGVVRTLCVRDDNCGSVRNAPRGGDACDG